MNPNRPNKHEVRKSRKAVGKWLGKQSKQGKARIHAELWTAMVPKAAR